MLGLVVLLNFFFSFNKETGDLYAIKQISKTALNGKNLARVLVGSRN